MKALLQEFKTFAVRGNVIDLAVAVVIGGAFGKIVSSLVDTLVTPLIGMFMGGVDLTGLSFEVGETSFRYGAFAQTVIDFVIIALVIFIAIKAVNRLGKKEEETVVEKPKEPSPEAKLLEEIRDVLKR